MTDLIKNLTALARLATRSYELPENLNVALINLSENATFKIEAPSGKRWALRVHRDGYHSRSAIASELAWLMALRESGVAITPKPVRGIDGEFIQDILHSHFAKLRHVVLSEWEDGIEPDIAQDLIKPFEILGEVTARMHAHARVWRRPPFFTRYTWNFETALGEKNPHWGRNRDGIGVDKSKAALFKRTADLIAKRLTAFGQTNERFGLIHGDTRLANILMDGDKVKVIDFDDCGFGWYMYDAATPISFYEHNAQVPALIDAWQTGYRKAGILSREDEQEIPTFIMFRRLLLVAWIGSHSETDLAKSMGQPYTDGTVDLCEKYLSNCG